MKGLGSVLGVFHKRHPPVGARPGTLVLPESASAPRVGVLRYDSEELESLSIDDDALLKDIVRDGKVTWIDVQGLGDEARLRTIAEIFRLHPLALEDVVNAPQRPKIEGYDQQLLIIARMMSFSERGGLTVEQISLFLGPGYVLTFQERYGDVLDPVRARLRENKGPIRGAGSDYLAYAILDTIIDGYYPAIATLGDMLEELEDEVMTGPNTPTLNQLNQLKATVTALRRAVWPQREALSRLIRDGSPMISRDVSLYLRDTYDHAAQAADVLDSHRELVNGLFNTYLSVLGQRTNEVMKVLTIIASIFIPLTFMTGIYGMNFQHMPELQLSWGYPALLALLLLTALGMVVYFWRRGWMGGREKGGRDDAR